MKHIHGVDHLVMHSVEVVIEPSSAMEIGVDEPEIDIVNDHIEEGVSKQA